MLGILYVLFIVVGWLILLSYKQKPKFFLWGVFLAIIAIPVGGPAGLYALEGKMPILIYPIGALLGPVMERFGGWFYYKINGSHLWTYKKFPLPGGYTSWLAAPFWGFLFVAIWAIVK